MSGSSFDDILSEANSSSVSDLGKSLDDTFAEVSGVQQTRKRLRADEESADRDDGRDRDEGSASSEKDGFSHEKNGGGGSSNGSGSQEVASTVSGAPDPAPQIDDLGAEEPKEGESEGEPDEQPDYDEPVMDAADDPAQPDIADSDDDSDGDEDADDSGNEQKKPARRTGSSPANWQRNLKFDHPSSDLSLRRFPADLLDRLRSILGAVVGDDFSDQMSNVQLVTAYVTANLGIDYDTDENTRVAIRAFQSLDPMWESLEDTVSSTQERIETLVRGVDRLNKRLIRVEGSAAAAELSSAFFVADRITSLPTSAMTVDSAAMDHHAVTTMRKTVRKHADALRKAEERSDGRSMS